MDGELVKAVLHDWGQRKAVLGIHGKIGGFANHGMGMALSPGDGVCCGDAWDLVRPCEGCWEHRCVGLRCMRATCRSVSVSRGYRSGLSHWSLSRGMTSKLQC